MAVAGECRRWRRRGVPLAETRQEATKLQIWEEAPPMSSNRASQQGCRRDPVPCKCGGAQVLDAAGSRLSRMALTIAETALAQCGINTSVAVVDRAGRCVCSSKAITRSAQYRARSSQGLHGAHVPPTILGLGKTDGDDQHRSAYACRCDPARRRNANQRRRDDRRRRSERRPRRSRARGSLRQGRHR